MRIVVTLHRLALIAIGLFTGAMLLIAASLVPYWQTLSPESFRISFQAIGPFLGRTMVPLLVLSAGLTMASALTPHARRGYWITPLCLVLAVFPLYGLVHAPANAALLASDPLTTDQIRALLETWAKWHTTRTFLGLGAFVTAIRAYSA